MGPSSHGTTAPRSASPLLTSDDGTVRTLTLNRPDRKNAMDYAQWVRLRDAMTAALDDHEVRVIVITGAGDAFCSGADLAASPTNHPITRMRAIAQVANLIHESPKPTIARVNGAAVGGGWNLALCCDFVIASSTAIFSQSFPLRGLSVDVGGSYLLPRLIGMQKAKQLTMLGDRVTADEAEALGLVTFVVPPEGLNQAVSDLSQRLAAGPPVALSFTKALLHQGASRSMAEALEAEAQAQAVNLAGEDVVAGFEAFRSRKPPSFSGGWRLTRGG